MYRQFISFISLVLVLGLTGIASAELVAHYKFDEGTGEDSAAYYADADANLYGDAQIVYDVNRGPVLELDGDGDYVRVINSAVADFGDESFSYAFWAKTTIQAPWFYFWKGDEVPEVGLIGVNAYRDNGPEVRFCLYNDMEGTCPEGKVRTEVVDGNCVSGRWAHIACVRNATTRELRFYVNGQMETSLGENNPVEDCMGTISNLGSLYIGANYRDPSGSADPTGLFTGRMDDFRVYNHALTVSEIQEIIAAVTDPNLASEPTPGNFVTNVCPSVLLTWSPGDFATSHDVYLGTDWDDVNDANSTIHPNVDYTNVDANSYSPATLELGTEYFWRVDGVKSDHTDSPWKGDIWRFTVEQGKALDPNPLNGALSIPVDKVVSWTPACVATSHDVYFGDNFNDVNDANTATAGVFKGNQSLDVNSYDPPGDLGMGTTYYWRIDENGGPSGTVKGDVWGFTTVGALLLHYKFDETEGQVASDSSGQDHNTPVAYDGEEDEPAWDPHGYLDGCLSFDGDTHLSVPMAALSSIDKGITVSVWLNNARADVPQNLVFETGAGGSFLRVEVPDLSGNVYWRAGNDTNDVVQWAGGGPASWARTWNHFAFVKDENENKMRIYFNGELAEEKTDTADSLAGVRNTTFRIGGPVSGGNVYQGKLDDFRIYDCALSEDEIVNLYRGADRAIAWFPVPRDRAEDVLWNVELTWKPGDFATSHDVYFGTDYNDVNDANTTVTLEVYKGNQNLEATSYDPCDLDPAGLLEFGQTYYWRIDEINDANAGEPNGSPWKGKVWSFTVASFIAVDDFESYTGDHTHPLVYIVDSDPNGTWIDGWTNYTGSLLDLVTAPNDLPVRIVTGRKSMDYGYDNTMTMGGYYYYSEAERPVTEHERKDWTVASVKALSVWFHGDPCNDPDQMYVAVEDDRPGPNHIAVVKYDGDANDLKKDEWDEWHILLTEFKEPNQTAANDVNLASVDRFYIGFGDREHPQYSGLGLYSYVGFDDIRVYPTRCVAKFGPEADLSGDCVVYVEDIDVMTDDWLDADYTVIAAAPNDANLMARYDFNETSGANVPDSSIYGYDGNVVDGTAVWDPCGYQGNSLNFDETYGVEIPNGVFSTINQAISISVWGNGDAFQPDDDTIILEVGKATGAGSPPWKGSWTLKVRIKADWRDAELEFTAAGAGETWEEFDVNDWAGEWNHYAFVSDRGTSFQGIYHNGELVEEGTTTGIIRGSTTTHAFIGIAPERSLTKPDDYHSHYIGRLDDFRIYNCRLSHAGIISIAGLSELYIPLESTAELYDQEAINFKKVNFKDYAVLMDAWLDVKLFPHEP